MTARRMLFVPFLFALALLVQGCAGPRQTYEGPTMPVSKVSVVEGYYAYSTGWLSRPGPKHEHTITVEGIDDSFNDKAKYGSDYHVLPGEHVLKVKYEHNTLGTVNREIKLTTRAGHRYLVAAARRGAKAYIWVVDITRDGRQFVKRGPVVAGELPPA